MGLMDFVKDAGEKLFGHGPAQAAVKEAAADPSSQAKVQAANSARPMRSSNTSSRST
jgi:hypothetical protein